MKKILFATFLTLSTSAFSQIQPSTTYDGGDLYFVPAKLTSNGIPFLYSYRDDYDSGKIWFTIFDDEVNVVKQVEIEAQTLSYSTRTITMQRQYFVKTNDGGTRSTTTEDEYFLDEWTVVDDVTEEKTFSNSWIASPEVYEDNNNYHSRYMYLSQILFDEDEDFEYLRDHYEIMPLSYCAADDKSNANGDISMERPSFCGEECDTYFRNYDHKLGGYVYTLIKRKVYGGLKHTGMEVVSLDGTIKKTLDGIADLNTVVAINGNFYVSAYNNASSMYGLYKIASVSTSIERVAETTSKTNNNITYSIDGFRVKPNSKGFVIRNGQKLLNK